MINKITFFTLLVVLSLSETITIGQQKDSSSLSKEFNNISNTKVKVLPKGSIINKQNNQKNGWSFINNYENNGSNNYLLRFENDIIIEAIILSPNSKFKTEYLLNDSATFILESSDILNKYKFKDGRLDGKVSFDYKKDLWTMRKKIQVEFEKGIPNGVFYDLSYQQNLLTFSKGNPNEKKLRIIYNTNYEDFFFKKNQKINWFFYYDWSDPLLYVGNDDIIYNYFYLGIIQITDNLINNCRDLEAPDIDNTIQMKVCSKTSFYNYIIDSQNRFTSFSATTKYTNGDKRNKNYINAELISYTEYDNENRIIEEFVYDKANMVKDLNNIKYEYGSFIETDTSLQIKKKYNFGYYVFNISGDTIYSYLKTFCEIYPSIKTPLFEEKYFKNDSVVYSMKNPINMKTYFIEYILKTDTSYFFDSKIIQKITKIAYPINFNNNNVLKHGEFNEFYIDGSLKISGNYYFDSPIGKWNYYNLKNLNKQTYYNINGNVDSTILIPETELYYPKSNWDFDYLESFITSLDNRFCLMFTDNLSKATVFDLKKEKIIISTFYVNEIIIDFINNKNDNSFFLADDGTSLIQVSLIDCSLELTNYCLISGIINTIKIPVNSTTPFVDCYKIKLESIYKIDSLIYLSGKNTLDESIIIILDIQNKDINYFKFNDNKRLFITSEKSFIVMSDTLFEIVSRDGLNTNFSNQNNVPLNAVYCNDHFFKYNKKSNNIEIYYLNTKINKKLSIPKIKVWNSYGNKGIFTERLEKVYNFNDTYYYIFGKSDNLLICKSDEAFEVFEVVYSPQYLSNKQYSKKGYTYKFMDFSNGYVFYESKILSELKSDISRDKGQEDTFISINNLMTDSISEPFVPFLYIDKFICFNNKKDFNQVLIFNAWRSKSQNIRNGYNSNDSIILFIDPSTINSGELKEENFIFHDQDSIINKDFNESDSTHIFSIIEYINSSNEYYIYNYNEIIKVRENKFYGMSDNFIVFYNSKKKYLIERYVRFMSTNDFESIFITPDNYYSLSSNNLSKFYFIHNSKSYPIEQFDLKYNRPDIILDRLGYADSSLIAAYHTAYLKRLKKMNFTEEMLEDDFHLPEIKIENFESLPVIDDQGSIELDLKLEDTKYNLDRINVWVNDVAVYGTNGISLRDKNVKKYETKLAVNLAKGNNKVQVSVLNQAGAESYKETFLIASTSGKQKPNLYLITIGISEFKQSDFNLKYAAKDAIDLAEIMKMNKIYHEVFVKTLTNEQVTKENIIALKTFFDQADINDEIMIFIAGHGILDAKLDYYFATYDMDFSNPAERGLAYSDLENLLDGISPLKKTLIIDACHSGEIDKDDVELAVNKTFEGNDIQFRVVGNTIKPKLGIQNTSELTQSLFTDLRKGTGATVISSAGGMEYAIEGDDWQNGLFTYCFINGIKEKKADYNKDGEIWLSEIKRYVSEQVTLLSNGKQQPTSRIENNALDYRIW